MHHIQNVIHDLMVVMHSKYGFDLKSGTPLLGLLWSTYNLNIGMLTSGINI